MASQMTCRSIWVHYYKLYLSSSFFEEEWYSRFLLLETDPDEYGVLYRIERKKKSERQAAVVYGWINQIVRGIEILVGFNTVKVPGTFHPKITIIYWANCIGWS